MGSENFKLTCKTPNLPRFLKWFISSSHSTNINVYACMCVHLCHRWLEVYTGSEHITGWVLDSKACSSRITQGSSYLTNFASSSTKFCSSHEYGCHLKPEADKANEKWVGGIDCQMISLQGKMRFVAGKPGPRSPIQMILIVPDRGSWHK